MPLRNSSEHLLLTAAVDDCGVSHDRCRLMGFLDLLMTCLSHYTALNGTFT